MQAAQQAFSRQLIASQERERQRIAAELHDSLGQNLLLVRNRALLGALSGPSEAVDAVRGDRRGFGLTGLAERVQMLGGFHVIESSPGRGTSVVVRVARRVRTNGR
jgi:signal transduction histidine kinase